MSDAIIVAIITGGLSLIGVIFSNSTTAKNMDAKLASCRLSWTPSWKS